jgi:hypothetical protein
MMTTGMRRLLSVCVFAQQASPVFMRISRNERRHADFCVQIVLGYCDIIVSGSHCHSEEAQPKKMCASPALLPPGARSRRVASECTVRIVERAQETKYKNGESKQVTTTTPNDSFRTSFVSAKSIVLAKMMVRPAEEESEAEVRRVDQDNINKFARLNARLHDLRDERSVIKVSCLKEAICKY